MAHQPLPGYEPLPDFPEEQPDSEVREVEELEGWSGSRTVVMESGFGSDSFNNKYRGGPSTAISGIEAMGNSSMYSPSSSTMKKKGNDYDLDAFYDESSDEEESSSEEDTTSESGSDSEDEEEEEEEEASDANSEEDSESESDSDESSGLLSSEDEEPVKTVRRK